MNCGTVTSATTGEPLTAEMLQEMFEKILKNKVTYKACDYIERGTVVIVNHEEIRKTIPGYTERGKTVMYNPADERISEVLTDNTQQCLLYQ